MPHEPDSYLKRVARATRRFFGQSPKLEDQILTEQRLRAAKYAQNWRDYRGETLTAMVDEDGRQQRPINLLKKNIDKINYFAFGKGFDLIYDEYSVYLDMAEAAWGSHMIKNLLRLGQTGSVCGDVYVMVAPTEVAQSLTTFNPKTALFQTQVNAEISIVVMDPSFVTPIYDSFNPDKLIGVSIDIPMKRFDQHGRWQTEYQHITITAEAVFMEMRDMNGGSIAGTSNETPNPIGHVYVHHIRNYPDGESLFGADDVTDVAPLNRELSKEINGVSQIIDYSGDPITLIFGARAKNLTKGKNKIWGGLPKDGKVENLTLDTDLAAATGNIDNLSTMLYALMGVPEIAQGSKQAISNTSGVALHTMYMPLIEKADTKHQIYGPHFIEIAITTLRWIQELKIAIPGVEKDGRSKKLDEEDFAKIRNNTVIKFGSVLPKDRLIEAQIQNVLLNAHLQDRAGALTALGEPNPEKKLKAIDKELKQLKKDGLLPIGPANHGKEEVGGGSPIESGASANQGENDDAGTEQQQGRRRTTNSGSRNSR